MENLLNKQIRAFMQKEKKIQRTVSLLELKSIGLIKLTHYREQFSHNLFFNSYAIRYPPLPTALNVTKLHCAVFMRVVSINFYQRTQGFIPLASAYTVGIMGLFRLSRQYE